MNNLQKNQNVRFVIVFPEIYEIGMSNLSIRVLHNLINKEQNCLCERAFVPSPKDEKYSQNNRSSLFSIERHRALKTFDCIGFSLNEEMNFINIPRILDISSIPIYFDDRKDEDPIVIAGGLSCYNPAPFSRFFDCIVIGEAEAVLPFFITLIKEWKSRGVTRNELYKELSKIKGIYVPSLNNQTEKVWVTDWELPFPYLSARGKIPFNSLMVEVARGCPRYCKFCQLSWTSKPYREKICDSVLQYINKTAKSTKCREVLMVAPSLLDYSNIKELLRRTMQRGYFPRIVSVKGDQIDEEISDYLVGEVSIAVEVGTNKLCKFIGKNINEENLLYSFKALCKNPKVTKIRIYFVIGLPEEGSDDIQGIINLIGKFHRTYPNPAKPINISISPFIPECHTPFQWEKMEKLEELDRKFKYLLDNLKFKGYKVKYPHVLGKFFLQGIFSRGDRSLSKVITTAWKKGITNEKFDLTEWLKIFEMYKIDPYSFIRQRDQKENFPWDNILTGIDKNDLLSFRNKNFGPHL